MKKLFLAFSILIFFAACTISENIPPTPIPPTETATPLPAINLPLVESPQLTQFYFYNENDGWGATESQIVRTNDGGVTWYDATPNVKAQFSYVPNVFFDAHTAWILISADDYITGTLYHTLDGGSTWSSNAVPFAYASLQFLDASNGFALASLGAGAGSEAVALFKTTDGGVNWMRAFINDPNDASANDSLPLGGQKYGFTFLDALRGWVGGAVPVDNYIYLYRTRDGGATWSETNIALPTGYESAQTGNYGPQFFSATEGILVVNLVMPSDPGLVTLVYRTSNGGEAWTPGQAISFGRPADFYTVSDGVAWGGGPFYVTRDAGQTWGAVTPSEDFTASLGSFQFVSPLVGWALTTNEALDPSLYKTTDGGATWTLLIP
jgi:photosystem II stability/assembly factor-like uncharacterized protein